MNVYNNKLNTSQNIEQASSQDKNELIATSVAKSDLGIPVDLGEQHYLEDSEVYSASNVDFEDASFKLDAALLEHLNDLNNESVSDGESQRIFSSKRGVVTEQRHYDISLSLNDLIDMNHPEKSVKLMQTAVHKALEINSSLISHVMQVDADIDMLKGKMKDLEAKYEATNSPRDKTHLEHQMNLCQDRIKSAEIERDSMLESLKEHKTILESNHAILGEHIEELLKSKKTKVREAALTSYQILKDSCEIIEKIDSLRHLGKAGTLIKEFQQIKETREFAKTMRTEILKEIEIKNKDASILDVYLSELEDLIKGKDDHDPQLPRLQQKFEELHSQKQRLSEALLNLEITAERLTVDINKSKTILHDIKEELKDEYSIGLATLGVTALSLLLESAHYMATIGMFASHALTALQIAETLVVAAAPAIHMTEVIVPILSIPFGLYELAKSSYSVGETVGEVRKLNKLNDIAKEYKAETQILQKKIDLLEVKEVPSDRELIRDIRSAKKHKKVTKSKNQKTDISIEMTRLKAQIDFHSKNIEILQNQLNNLGEKEDFNQLTDQLTLSQSQLLVLNEKQKLYRDLENAKMKYQTLKTFVNHNKAETIHKAIGASLGAGAAVAMVGTGVATIVSLAGVTAPGGAPVALILTFTAAGFCIANLGEKAAFSAGKKLQDTYQMSTGQFGKTEAGMMYNLGLIMKEEASSPNSDSPITKLVLGYYGLKNPERFIQRLEEKSHKKAKNHPDYANFVAKQNSVIMKS